MGSEERFGVVVAQVDGRAVVQLHGELDVLAAPTLREALHALRNVGEQEISLDLTDAAFIDSSVIGVIGEMVRTGAWVTITGASAFAQRVLDLTGLSSLCTMVADRAP